MSDDFRERLLAHAAESFVKDTKDHVVRQLHYDGDVVRLWRCASPNSSIYSFSVEASLGWLIVYGDMGACMWSRTLDMVSFVRGSVHSLDYFSEKVPTTIAIKQHYPELIEEWFRDIKGEWIEGGNEWTEDHDAALADIRSEYEECHCKDDFNRALAHSVFYHDFESIPDTTYYTFRYLWTIEGLKWWIQRLDAGEVIKPEPEEEESNAH